MKVPRLISCLWLYWTIALAALADHGFPQRTTSSGQYRVTNWTTEQGLPQNTVNCLLQARNGYLWIGTRYGLARYDGKRFTVYIDELCQHNTEDLDIWGLAEDVQGRLWMHSPKALICYHQGRFQQHSFQDGLSTGPIRHMKASRNGGLWMITPRHLFRVQDGAVGRSFSLGEILGKNDSPTTKLEQVLEDEQGLLWIQTGYVQHQLTWSRFNPRRGALENPAPLLAAAGEETCGLIEDRRGRIWVGKPGELLCWENGSLSRFSAQQAWGKHLVKRLVEDAQGQIWILSEGPVQLHRFADGQFTGYDRATGLTNPDDVRCLLPDREGNLWAGTGSGGLHRLQPRTLVNLLTGSLSMMDEVYSVAPGRGGKVWMATTYGLVQYQHGQFAVYTNAKAFDKSYISDRNIPRVRPVLEDRKGEVWFGQDFDFLSRLENEQLVAVDLPGRSQHVLGKVKSLIEDRAGNLWVASPSGLLQHKQGAWRLWTTQDGLSGNSVYGLVEDPAGGLWVGTRQAGINQLKEGRFHSYTKRDGLLSQEAWPLRAEGDGTVWVGTPRGLNRIRAGQISAVTTRQGLHDNLAYCLLEDRRGNYWSFSNRGIWRVKQVDLHAVADGRASRVLCIAYGEDDGMASAEGNGDQHPNAALLPNGELWFPTTRGVVIVDPDKLRDDETRPLVVIEEVLADEEIIFKDGEHPLENRNPSSSRPKNSAGSTDRQSAPIGLPPGRARVLSIRYTANTFVESEKARFRYQLAGYDTGWREADTRREAIYTNLRPGSYRFLVQACNHHGYWSEQPAEFVFSLAPFFYETRLFYGLGGFGMVAILAIWHSSRLRASRRIQRLEQQRALEEERNRIAKDLHDDLGANLTGLALQVEVARAQSICPVALQKQLLDFAYSIRAVADRLREVIWTVNPHCDTLDSFSAYLCDYAEGFLEKAGLRCRLDLPAELPSRMLSAEARHHLLLVAKEALNNTAKHAAATEACLSLKVAEEEVIMVLEDNGRGFPSGEAPGLDPEEASQGGGRGLGNMRRRIEMLGGRFDLASRAGQGTQIQVRVPLAKRL